MQCPAMQQQEWQQSSNMPRRQSNSSQGAAKKIRGMSEMVHQTVSANVETKLQKGNREESIFIVETKKSERGAKGTGRSGSGRH